MMSVQTITTQVKSCAYQLGQVRLPCTSEIAIPDDGNLDRVLYRGTQLDLIVYSRAELKGSDHRPGLYPCLFSS